MVFIASHTWPNQWLIEGIKNKIVVYSNCDEVELFNDVNALSLGKKRRNGIGTHFEWNALDIRFNFLYAVGYVNGKKVATDRVLLNQGEPSPQLDNFNKGDAKITAPQPGYNYLYRVNCGGPEYTDGNGSKWMADLENADRPRWGSVSWTNDFQGMPPSFASQRRIFDPINGTRDWKLFQTFRYGREKLHYHFPVKDGEYLVELYFVEPWYGVGGGINCTGWRLFDVAVNGKKMIRNLDIWNEVGQHTALKKIIKARVTGGELVISFPRVLAGQAIICAIAIASVDKTQKSSPAPESILKTLNQSKSNHDLTIQHWLDLGDEQYSDSSTIFVSMPAELFGAEWIKMPEPMHNDNPYTLPDVVLTRQSDIYVGVEDTSENWRLKSFTNTKYIIRNNRGEDFLIYKKRFQKGDSISLEQLGGISIYTYQKFLLMAQPVTNIEPAYDLKPVSSYKAIDARWSGEGINKGKVDGKDRVIFNRASPNNLLEWTFNVGVGDMYSLTISYNNPQAKEIKGKLQLLLADGHLLKEEEVVFTPTPVGKSNYISTNTGTMINAGKYILKLTSTEAEGLSINSLDVQ
jgi:hypothetical protein